MRETRGDNRRRGTLSAGGGPPACQGHQRRSAKEQIQAVIVKPDAQPVSDEPRGHRVEHLPERERGAASDGTAGMRF